MTEEERALFIADTENYASLLTSDLYSKPKTNELARSVVRPGIDLSMTVQSITMAFNIDNANGDQLDIIGEYVGLPRLLNYAPATGSREMDDEEYRLSLKLAVARNTWDGSFGSIEKVYKEILGDEYSIVVKDNQDMTIEIDVYGDVSTRMLEIFENAGLLLIPVGVGKTVQTEGGTVSTDLYMGIGISSIEQVDYVYAD